MSNDVKVRLRAESGELRAEFKRANKQLTAFGSNAGNVTKRLIGMGAAVVGLRAGSAVIGDLLEKFDRIGKVSTTLGESTEDIQRLGLAAEFTGTSLETITRAASDLEKRLGEADTNPAIARALEGLNLSAQELKGLSLKEQIGALAKAYNSAGDPTEAYADLTQLLGGQVKKLIPLLKEGADGVDRLTADLNVLSDGDVRSIEAFNDQLTLIKTNLQSELAASFTDELDRLGDLALDAGDAFLKLTSFVLNNKDSIKALLLAYAGFKIGGIISSFTAMTVQTARSTAALVASRLALKAESAELARNSVAQRMNAGARGALSKSFTGANLGGIASKTFKNLGPVVATAIAGWEIGSLLNDQFKIDEKVVTSLFSSLDKVEVSTNDLVSNSRARVEAAKDELALQKEIRAITNSVRELESSADDSSGAEREAFEYAIQAQKILLANAEKINEAAQRRAAEAANATEASEKELASRKAISAEEQKILDDRQKARQELEAEVDSLLVGVNQEIFDEQSESGKITRLRDQMAREFKTIESISYIRGAGGTIEDAKDLVGLSKLISLTRETNPKDAKLVAEYALRMVESTKQIDQLNTSINAKQDARKALTASLLALEARANGNPAVADQIEKEIKLQELKTRYMEELGLREEEALKQAEKKLSLEEKIAAQRLSQKATLDDLKKLQFQSLRALSEQVSLNSGSFGAPVSSSEITSAGASVVNVSPVMPTTTIDPYSSVLQELKAVLIDIRNNGSDPARPVNLDRIVR